MTYTTYDEIFCKVFNCLPNESKPLEEYSKDELIRLINLLKDQVNKSNLNHQISLDENPNYGLSIIGNNENDLVSFKEYCLKNFLPISNGNCHVSTICNENIIEQYLSTGINYFHIDYAVMIILKNVEYNHLSSLSYDKQFSLNNKSYKYRLKLLIQNHDETYDELLNRIRITIIGDDFFKDLDDHASIPSLPSLKQPEFVSITPFTEIACWHLPRQRDLKFFQQDLGVTHILTLLNHNEVRQSTLCQRIETAGITLLHVPIEGADISVFTSLQSTFDVLSEQIPTIVQLLLNSTQTSPVRMIIHCSAGLHRTGTIAYLLLRLCHFGIDQSLLIINRTRSITARQVGHKRINAAENVLLKVLQ